MKRLALLSCLCCVAACGGGGGSGGGSSSTPSESVDPVLSSINISPLTIHFTGGDVTVSADATDNVGIASVVVNVSGAGSQQVSLSNSSGDTYSGTVSLPANESLVNQDAVYSLQIVAADDASNQASSASFNVTVSSMLRPPEPPMP